MKFQSPPRKQQIISSFKTPQTRASTMLSPSFDKTQLSETKASVENWDSLKFNSTIRQKSFGVPAVSIKSPTKFSSYNLSISMSETKKIERERKTGPSILN
jgi:hypothetical protein